MFEARRLLLLTLRLTLDSDSEVDRLVDQVQVVDQLVDQVQVVDRLVDQVQVEQEVPVAGPLALPSAGPPEVL